MSLIRHWYVTATPRHSTRNPFCCPLVSATGSASRAYLCWTTLPSLLEPTKQRKWKEDTFRLPWQIHSKKTMPLSDIVNKHLIVSRAFTAAMYKSTDMCLSKPIGSTLMTMDGNTSFGSRARGGLSMVRWLCASSLDGWCSSMLLSFRLQLFMAGLWMGGRTTRLVLFKRWIIKRVIPWRALLSYLLDLVIPGQNRGNLSGKLQREHTTDKTLTFPVHGTVARFLGLRVSASSSLRMNRSDPVSQQYDYRN